MQLLRSILLVCLLGCATPPPDFSRVSTAELQLERSQLNTRLGNSKFEYATSSDKDAQLGISFRIRNIAARKEVIERELLRRYEVGDKSAKIRASDDH